jgi:hypothetical protein
VTAPEDDLAIRALLATMLDSVARGDADAWGSCWTDDGVWVIPGFGELVGAEATARFAELRGGYDLCIQALLSGSAEVDGDVGTGRWYFRELQRTRTTPDPEPGAERDEEPGGEGAGAELIGCYDDEYRRTPDGWRFARRRFWILYRGPVSLGGTVRRPPPPP